MAPKNQRDLSGYRYSALSSLVLSAGHRQDQNEPTGEAESLVGRIDPKSMGSRVVKSQVQDVERKRKVAESDDYGMVKKRNWNPGTAQYANVLQASAELDGLRYIPRTDETRSVYELVLTMIQSALGDQTTEVVRSAADTAIEILKDDSVRDLDKKREMETFLGPLPEEKFSQYVNLSKQLTDYEEDTSAHAETSTGVDDEAGVAVLFDNEEEESNPDEETYVVREASDDEDDQNSERNEAAEEREIHDTSDLATNEEDLVLGGTAETTSSDLDVHDIDAYWLQRILNDCYSDPVESGEKTDAALEILGAETDIRECENSLMALFDYDHFDVVQTLTKNRDIVYWCTRLSRSNEDERMDVEVAMRERNAGWILKRLAGDAAKPALAADELEEAKRQAHRLTSRATLAPGSTAAPRLTLDLSLIHI